MECAYYQEQFSLLLTDSLDPVKRREIKTHLAGCRNCQTELKATQKLWDLMAEIPQPSLSSTTMKAGFNEILQHFKEETTEHKNGWQRMLEKLSGLWRLHPGVQLAYSFLLLVIGLAIGFISNRGGQTNTAEIKHVDSLSSQLTEMKQLMLLSLLENPSASERMRAVSYTDQISSVNKKVIDALLTTLNEDPNTNVRLVTLESLVKLSGDPGVREGLVQSITRQESPLLQSAIADAMVRLQEKRSLKSLQKLLDKKDLNEMVRNKIEQSIHKLI